MYLEHYARVDWSKKGYLFFIFIETLQKSGELRVQELTCSSLLVFWLDFNIFIHGDKKIKRRFYKSINLMFSFIEILLLTYFVLYILEDSGRFSKPFKMEQWLGRYNCYTYKEGLSSKLHGDGLGQGYRAHLAYQTVQVQ